MKNPIGNALEGLRKMITKPWTALTFNQEDENRRLSILNGKSITRPPVIKFETYEEHEEYMKFVSGKNVKKSGFWRHSIDFGEREWDFQDKDFVYNDSKIFIRLWGR